MGSPSTVRRVVRKLRGKATKRWRQTQPKPAPVVSVIVPIYNVERYLDDCLRSVRSQSYEHLEIIIVDDGSPDASFAIARAHAEEDPRIHLVRQENAGLGAARNTGIRNSSGAYLTFVDSDDLLPPSSVSVMVRSAERTGSDIVVGAAMRFNATARWKPEWLHLHSHERTAIHVAEFPEIIRNNYTWSKLFRSQFWKTCGLAFREGVAYEDQPIITQLYIRAQHVDVLPNIVYEWRQREDATSISQQTHSLSDLRDRIAAWDASASTLQAEASPEVFGEWLRTLYTAHFHWYMRSRSTAHDEYWSELQSVITRMTDLDTGVRTSIPPAENVAIELVRRNLRHDFHEFKRVGGYKIANFPAHISDDGLTFELPTFNDPKIDIPNEVYSLPTAHIPLVHRLDRAHWTDTATLHLEGWGYFRYVDLTDRRNRITVEVEHERSGRHVRAQAEANDQHMFLSPTDDKYAKYETGAFKVDVDLEEFLVACQLLDRDTLRVRLIVETGPLSEVIEVSRVYPRGSARHLMPLPVEGGMLVSSDMGNEHAFRLYHIATRVALESVRLDGGRLSGRLRVADELQVDRLELAAVRSSKTLELVDIDDSVPEEFDCQIPLDAYPVATADASERWSLRAILQGAKSVAVITEPGTVDGVGSVLHRAGLTLQQSGRAATILQASNPVVDIASAHVQDEAIKLTGRVPGISQCTLSFVLSAPSAASHQVDTIVEGGHFEASIPLQREVWRYGDHPLPAADYGLLVRITTSDHHQRGARAEVTDALSDQLPTMYESGTTAGTLTRGAGKILRLQLRTPIGSARGAYNRRRLEQAGPALRRSQELEGVLFQSNFGEVAGCSGAAVHRELRRRGSHLSLYWAVRDHSVVVPHGAIPVVRGSTPWFELLQSTQFVIDNMFQPVYHQKPTDQTIVQTLHGYPFKVMGHEHWKNLQFSKQHIASYDSRSAEWDFLVSPARYATPLLRRDFAYDGRILEIGYPRNDVLQDTPHSRQIRESVRESLNISPDINVVLYAPTFRDYLSADDHTADMGDFLDFEYLASALGDNFTILVRGHAFNARTRLRPTTSARVVDVTDYPDPADLYLASDAAVLDYSSLRFDYAVTGKPMLFLVPDIDRYKSTRGWIVDFSETAPGPKLSTTDEVADGLMDLSEVESRYRAVYKQFQDDYLELEDGHASARLVDAVFTSRGVAPPSA